MKISEVKREFQLQQWRGMVLERKESALSVKEWCSERGITEHAYFYRLRQLRISACQALQEAQPVQLAEVPLAPKVPERHASLRLTTRAGTLEIMDADRQMLELVLRGCSMLNNATGFDRIYIACGLSPSYFYPHLLEKSLHIKAFF